MPVRMGKRTYKSFGKAKAAVKRKGIRNPAAYVAAVERAQGRDPRTGKAIRKVRTKRSKGKRKRKAR